MECSCKGSARDSAQSQRDDKICRRRTRPCSPSSPGDGRSGAICEARRSSGDGTPSAGSLDLGLRRDGDGSALAGLSSVPSYLVKSIDQKRPLPGAKSFKGRTPTHLYSPCRHCSNRHLHQEGTSTSNHKNKGKERWEALGVLGSSFCSS